MFFRKLFKFVPERFVLDKFIQDASQAFRLITFANKVFAQNINSINKKLRCEHILKYLIICDLYIPYAQFIEILLFIYWRSETLNLKSSLLS